VLLPAEVFSDAAVPDPSGCPLALVTYAAVAPGGNKLLNLCVLELRAGGTFRDIGDPGARAAVPAAAPVARAPEGASGADRLMFVGPTSGASSSNASSTRLIS
jgi:hypothetical protein